MFKNIALSILLTLGLARAAVPSVSLPLDWTSASGISRANLNLNPIALRDGLNVAIDSLNPMLALISGFSSSLSIASNQDMILKVDADANGSNKFVITANNIDTLFRINEADSTAKLTGPLTVAGLSTLTGNVNVNGATNTTDYRLNVKDGHIAATGTYAVYSFGLGTPSSIGAGNTESVSILHNGTNGILRVSKTGTGSYRDLLIQNNGSTQMTVAAAGGVTVANTLGVTGNLSVTDHLLTTGSTFNIRNTTSDGSDNGRLNLTAGGVDNGDVSRGAYISLRGNENTTTGTARIAAGNVAGGTLILATGNDVPALTISETQGATFSSTLGVTGVVQFGTGTPSFSTKRLTVIGNSFDNTALQLENTDVALDANGRQFNLGVTDVSGTEGRLDLTQPGIRTILSAFKSGGVGIGSTTDGGEAFQVTGTARITGAAALGSTLGVTGKVTGSDTVAGLLGFRAGNTAASNTILYRSGADMWTTPDSMTVGGTIVMGKGVVGDQSAGDSAIGLYVKPASLLGPLQAGIDSKPTCTASATTCYGMISFPLSDAGSYTITGLYGLLLPATAKGAGVTVTNHYGLEVGNIDQGTNNWAIKTSSGKVQFGDSLVIARSLTYTNSSTPPNPASSGAIRQYQKGSMIVFQYNDAGTVRYKYLDMAGTGVTWVHSTSAP